MPNRDSQLPAPAPRNGPADETSSARSDDERWLRLAAQQAACPPFDLLLAAGQVSLEVTEAESVQWPLHNRAAVRQRTSGLALTCWHSSLYFFCDYVPFVALTKYASGQT